MTEATHPDPYLSVVGLPRPSHGGLCHAGRRGGSQGTRTGISHHAHLHFRRRRRRQPYRGQAGPCRPRGLVRDAGCASRSGARERPEAARRRFRGERQGECFRRSGPARSAGRGDQHAESDCASGAGRQPQAVAPGRHRDRVRPERHSLVVRDRPAAAAPDPARHLLPRSGRTAARLHPERADRRWGGLLLQRGDRAGRGAKPHARSQPPADRRMRRPQLRAHHKAPQRVERRTAGTRRRFPISARRSGQSC